MALGTIHGQLKSHEQDLKLVFIDAHADLNDFENSSSKNLHGMPVNHALGIDTKFIQEYLPWVEHKLDPSNLIYVGIRALDDYEIKEIKQLGITYFGPEEIDGLGGIHQV